MNVALGLFVSLAFIVIFSALLRRRYIRWHQFRDRRSFRELVMSIALFIAAWSASLSALFGIAQIGTLDHRRVLGGIAWAAFLCYGVVALQETGDEAE